MSSRPGLVFVRVFKIIGRLDKFKLAIILESLLI